MKDITIVAIDSLQYQATEFAIRQTKKIFPNSPVVYFSDKEFYPKGEWVEVEPFDRYGHSVICHKLAPFIDTDYALFIQYDGFPVNPRAWTGEFLDYDYIGAPWPWYPEGSNVGNGGFSLRSKHLMNLCLQMEPQFDGDDSKWLEDGMIGVHYRPWLESKGIKFAPTALASRFSHEHPFGVKTASFGFHDKANIQTYLTPNQLQEWMRLVL